MAWRVNRRTGRERPFRPRLGGCLLWFLILVAIVLVLALFLGGFRKGTAAVQGTTQGVGSSWQSDRAW